MKAKLRPFSLICLVLLLAFLAAPALVQTAWAQTAFLQDLDDVPLPAGLVEDEAAGLSFDKPSGRIVEAEASGALPQGEVRDFYARTLPQLGWTAEGGDRFLRAGESLSLSYSEVGGSLTVHYTLQPE
jgi:hypothetical protein